MVVANKKKVSNNVHYRKFYVSKEFIGIVAKLYKVANDLNVSFLRLLLDERYRNNKFVQKELKIAKMVVESENAFVRINRRLRDSLIFDKANYSTLRLEERGMDKKDIINNFKDELVLVKNSVVLSNNSKRILTKKIKAQLTNFREHSISMLHRRNHIKKIVIKKVV